MWKDGAEGILVAAILQSLALFAVGLRFVAKFKSKARLKISDGLIVLSLFAFAATTGTFIRGVISSGGTLDLRNMNFLQASNIYGWIYISELVFTVTVTLIKFSIIAFYYDLFGVASRPFKRTMLIIAALCTVWFFVCFFVGVFQCRPTSAAWRPDLVFGNRAKCINFGKFITGYETTNMALDIAIIVSCIVMVMRLQLSTVKLWVVGSVIGLGGFVCVMCIMRIYYFTKFSFTFGLGTINLKLLLIWSNAQLAVAIVCACLPCYGPLLPTQKAAEAIEQWTRNKSRNSPTKNNTRRVGTNGFASYSEIESPARAHHRDASYGGIRIDNTYEVKVENLDFAESTSEEIV